ncbi:MAG: hypothetical protein COB71_02905 [Thiotrichales bacterium]|nr:MAG: hypothetical protein COB71_02905 [Thiotrichales bacterium]
MIVVLIILLYAGMIMNFGQHGSAEDHKRYMEQVISQGRRRCHCGCTKRATHRGMANGVCLTIGCELYVRRWVRDGINARKVGV